MKKTVQAKSLTDEKMFETIAKVGGSLFCIQAALAPIPPKVVLAKLRSMVKRFVAEGCTCGCRGNFERKKT